MHGYFTHSVQTGHKVYYSKYFMLSSFVLYVLTRTSKHCLYLHHLDHPPLLPPLHL